MKSILIFLLFISSVAFGMHHEKLDVIVFAIDLEINEGKKDSAKDFVSKITDNVKRNEPQTLVYQYHFSNKENKVFLLEIYPNNEAALLHMKIFTGSNWEAEFVENFSIKNIKHKKEKIKLENNIVNKTIFIPDTKIKIDQLRKTNKV